MDLPVVVVYMQTASSGDEHRLHSWGSKSISVRAFHIKRNTI
jgi:hypothetical protein